MIKQFTEDMVEEWFCAEQMGRKFIGIELKESYYRQAESNLLDASQGQSLFAWAQEQEEDAP